MKADKKYLKHFVGDNVKLCRHLVLTIHKIYSFGNYFLADNVKKKMSQVLNSIINKSISYMYFKVKVTLLPPKQSFAYRWRSVVKRHEAGRGVSQDGEVRCGWGAHGERAAFRVHLVVD